MWQTVADTPRDATTSCIITGRTRFEKAHVVPQAQEEWFTNNTMWEHAEGVDSASHSAANVCCLRPDLHKIFDDRAFTLVPKLEADGCCHTVVHFFSTQNGIADVALCHHNRKVHSLDVVAPQFLFARFAFTVFAYIKNFVLRGAQRQIAVVQRGIEPSGRPSWVTKVVDMDRAERHKRYGGGGSRASSPSKRSRPPSDYQRDASESVDAYVPAWEDDGRTAAWIEGDRGDDEPRGRKRQRTEQEDLLPSLTSSFSCPALHDEPSPPVHSDPIGINALQKRRDADDYFISDSQDIDGENSLHV